MQVEEKVCIRCLSQLPISEFTIGRCKENGKIYSWISGICKSCKKEDKKKERIKHIERYAAQKKRYHIKNAEKIKKMVKAWIDANREKHNEYNRKTKKSHRKEYYEVDKKWKAANKEKVSQYAKNYRKRQGRTFLDKANERSKKHAKEGIPPIADWYAKQLLVEQGIPVQVITQDLIETKRIILKFKRNVQNKTSNKHAGTEI